MRPPKFAPDTHPSSPKRFALKCPSDHQDTALCGRVRVFSYLETGSPGATLTEIPPILPLYTFIHEMEERGGRRAKIAEFLIAACDLHMIGLLESDAESRDAAFAAAAVHLRKAAELFLRRMILRQKQPFPKVGIRVLLKGLKKSPPGTLEKATRPVTLARRLQYVFDVGDIAAHPEVSVDRLRKNKYKWPATDGTIRTALAYFEEVVGMVRWK